MMRIPKKVKLVTCCGMSRSGSTLQYQLTKALLEHVGWGRGVGFAMQWNESENAIIKAERYAPWIGEMIDAGDAIGISIHRDPRDVAVSLHYYYTQLALHRQDLLPSFEEDIIEKWLPLTIEWHDDWTAHGVPSWSYESITPPALISVIARSFGIDLPTEDALALAGPFGVISNHARTLQQVKWLDLQDTLLTKRHVSPTLGRSTWRDRLTINQVLAVQEVAKEWMERWGYTPVGYLIDPSTPYHWDGVPGDINQNEELWHD